MARFESAPVGDVSSWPANLLSPRRESREEASSTSQELPAAQLPGRRAPRPMTSRSARPSGGHSHATFSAPPFCAVCNACLVAGRCQNAVMVVCYRPDRV